MSETTSLDGTKIAYDERGSGPAVIVVDGAFCSRVFGPATRIAPLLAHRFTVITYDRRGRGASGDATTYSLAREVEDLAALINAAGAAPASSDCRRAPRWRSKRRRPGCPSIRWWRTRRRTSTKRAPVRVPHTRDSFSSGC